MAKQARRRGSGQGGGGGGRKRARSKGPRRSLKAAGLYQMVESLQRFARRQPLALIGGAVLVGLALGTAVRTGGRVRSAREIGASAGRHWKGGRIERRPGRAADAQYGSAEPSLAAPSRGMAETAGAPAPAQASAGMGTGTGASPSSATDVSVSSSGYAGGGEPGAISTGNP